MTTLMERPPFVNELVQSFADPAAQRAMEEALATARQHLGARYPLVIGGERLKSEHWIESRNPANPREIIGLVASASRAHAEEALRIATEAGRAWGRRSLAERASLLFSAAERVRSQRARFNALLVLEVGKPWVEADGETAEAIDFLEYYGREALRYASPPPLTAVPGERGALRYLPLGVGVVIPPWNFPFAIMAGMTAAALVSGNTVVLKPSSDSPVVAAAFIDLLLELRLPPGVVNFVPGAGREIGDPLVLDRRTRFIGFTGSRAVGLRINELAAKPEPGHPWIKRVVAELGGKNAIVVAADADLEAAAEGIVASAFGYSGQKCSACSRLIVDVEVHDALLERVVARTRRLRIGDPSLAATEVGPVINAAARSSILSYLELGKSEGRLVVGGNAIESEGYWIEPTIFADCSADARIVREEIFGPVLTVLKALDFNHALDLANDSEYGLTGSLYARDQRLLDRAAEEFSVGNLYLNRKCTGALVGAHPFGGFRMSGTDSKAGGSEYLGLFMQAKSIAQRII